MCVHLGRLLHKVNRGWGGCCTRSRPVNSVMCRWVREFSARNT